MWTHTSPYLSRTTSTTVPTDHHTSNNPTRARTYMGARADTSVNPSAQPFPMKRIKFIKHLVWCNHTVCSPTQLVWSTPTASTAPTAAHYNRRHIRHTPSSFTKLYRAVQPCAQRNSQSTLRAVGTDSHSKLTVKPLLNSRSTSPADQ